MNTQPLRTLTTREIHEQLYPNGHCTCGCVDKRKPVFTFKGDTPRRASARLWAAKRDMREAKAQMGLAELSGDIIALGTATARYNAAHKRFLAASNRREDFRKLR